MREPIALADACARALDLADVRAYRAQAVHDDGGYRHDLEHPRSGLRVDVISPIADEHAWTVGCLECGDEGLCEVLMDGIASRFLCDCPARDKAREKAPEGSPPGTLGDYLAIGLDALVGEPVWLAAQQRLAIGGEP